MGQPALLFGLGATRAGTSWLYRYLAGHPQCHFRTVKELHYFDVVDSGGWEWWLRHLAQRRAVVAGRLARVAPGPGRAEPDRRLSDYDGLIALLGRRCADDAAYLEYIAAGAGPGVRLIGDITPAYGLLPEAALGRMQALAPVTRFVYLLRDPVARLWSNIRQVVPLRGGGGDDTGARARRIFDRVLAGREGEILRRSDYAGTLSRLARALRPENLLVQFHETLFAEPALRGLCGFLGIDFRPAETARRVNEAVAVPLDPTRRAAARRLLAPQYDHVRETFGDAVPASWLAEPAEV
jgi:hypothetical protein